METWKEVWRKGFAPLLSKQALHVLAEALETNDQRLLQGATTSPPQENQENINDRRKRIS